MSVELPSVEIRLSPSPRLREGSTTRPSVSRPLRTRLRTSWLFCPMPPEKITPSHGATCTMNAPRYRRTRWAKTSTARAAGSVAGPGAAGNQAEVGRYPAQAEQAPLAEQASPDLGCGHTRLHEVEHHRRIDVAAPGSHDEPLQRRHTHGRVHRLPVPDRACRGSGAEMEGHQVGPGVAEQPGCSLRQVPVADPVEPVTPHPEVPPPALGHRRTGRRGEEAW